MSIKGIFHIPHSSTLIPQEFLKYFFVGLDELNIELLKMTDHFTDEIFDIKHTGFDTLKFPVSRLLIDPERFELDEDEVMSKVGMGCIYEKTHNGKMLKNASAVREELIKRYYRTHHEKFSRMVEKIVNEHSEVIIIDCHSFPKHPLPYELNQEFERAEICIGTDEFHTPIRIRDKFVTAFSSSGFTVSVDKPFSGSIVPMKFFRVDRNVKSIMIELRRDLYMNEETGEKSENFQLLKKTIKKILTESDIF